MAWGPFARRQDGTGHYNTGISDIRNRLNLNCTYIVYIYSWNGSFHFFVWIGNPSWLNYMDIVHLQQFK
jgi:hypothetical protein